MHLSEEELGVAEAIRLARALRPAINPIGDFPALLDKLHESMSPPPHEGDEE